MAWHLRSSTALESCQLRRFAARPGVVLIGRAERIDPHFVDVVEYLLRCQPLQRGEEVTRPAPGVHDMHNVALLPESLRAEETGERPRRSTPKFAPKRLPQACSRLAPSEFDELVDVSASDADESLVDPGRHGFRPRA